MIVVHVIGPTPETPRHELHFEDGTTDEQVLAALRVADDKGRVPADYIGRVLTRGVDPETGKPGIVAADEWVVDHPGTVVAVGEIYFERGQKLFREVRRLSGPPMKAGDEHAPKKKKGE